MWLGGACFEDEIRGELPDQALADEAPAADAPPADAPQEVPPPEAPPAEAPPAEEPAAAPIVIAPVSLDGQALVDWGEPPTSGRGAWFGRPTLRYAHLGAPASVGAARVGLMGGRRWSTTSPGAVQWGGQVELAGSALLLGASGGAARASAEVGPWLGPLGVRVGPTVRVDQSTWGDDTLATDVLVGGRAQVAVDVGPVSPWASVEPAWGLLGQRAAANPVTATLPVLGTETSWGSGVDVQVSWLRLGLSAGWTETAFGRVLDVGGALALKPGG